MKKIFSRRPPDTHLPTSSLSSSSSSSSNCNNGGGLSAATNGGPSGLSAAVGVGGVVLMSAPPPSAGPWTVGRHHVSCEEVIAEGGFGVVFLVRQKDVRFALKRIFVNNEKDLAVCRREINIVSNLNGHKNIIGYVDSSIILLDGGIHEVLLLMPYHKTNLLQMMNERLNVGFSEAEVMSIFCDICSAVSRLHHCQTPIIHRDLKIENVLRSEAGHYVLCDFGSATAKVLNAKVQGITQVEEEIKRYTTLSYRSPEMTDLYSEQPLTSKTDIWALGCLLYKICFFTLPFGESVLAIQAGNFNFPPNSKYSTNMHKLIRYILTVDVTERPDIFQVIHLACQIANKPCSIQNLHNSTIPSFDAIDLSSKQTSSTAAEPTSSTSKVAKEIPQPQLITKVPLLEPTNTSVTPRQRPRGQNKVPAAPGVILPLPPAPSPLPPSAALAPVTAAPAPVMGPPVMGPPVMGPPVTSNPFSQKQQPQQLENSYQSSPSKNPFATSSSMTATTTADPGGEHERYPSLNPFLAHSATSAPSGNWNPFEDTKKFGELSEEALFGEQFDRIRLQQQEQQHQRHQHNHNNNNNSSQQQQQASSGGVRRDPFVSAPFLSTARDAS